MNVRAAALCALALATAVAPPMALAQAEPAILSSHPIGETVEVRIGAVLASNTSNEFDHRLASLHRQFNRFFTYSSYQLVKEERKRVAWGARAGFEVPGGRYVVVIPREHKNDRVSMKVLVIEGARPIIDTVLSLRDRGTFLLGGPRQPDGALILAIGADTRQ